MINRLLPYQNHLLIIGAFCLPIKLSFAYICFIPSILLWLARCWRGETTLLGSSARISAPLLLYFIAVALCAPFGINPLKSLPNVAAAAFMMLLIPVYGSIKEEKAQLFVIVALIAGQTLAAIDSIVTQLSGFSLRFFVGAVTESGQLALVIPLIFGMLRYFNTQRVHPPYSHVLFSSELRQELLALLLIVLLLLSSSMQHSGLLSIFTATLFVLLGFGLYTFHKNGAAFSEVTFSLLILFALPLTLVTLIINLKRGPWAGVLVALSIYFLMYRPRAFIPAFAVALIAISIVAPVRERILSVREHFFISGGRSEIWDIGAELINTYPMGIGFRNSSVLNKFSTDIPQNLRHFHSNPINIAVESGAFGLLLFYWWLSVCLLSAYRAHGAIEIGIACSLVSWQTAGLVEFNVGDTEVLYIAYLLVGVLAASITRSSHALNEVHSESVSSSPEQLAAGG